jgi:nitroreductase/NAD-dependent dihydropyrimidine dehydrogenase PreA subunit
MTILVDQSLCNRCGICSEVCPASIVEPAQPDGVPSVTASSAESCLECGHCEAYCPSQALALNLHLEDRVFVPKGAGALAAPALTTYLQKRRSAREFVAKPLPKEKILLLLDVARYAASAGNGQPVQWLVVYDPARVHKIAQLVAEWMKLLQHSTHPMRDYVPKFLAAWEAGKDVICRGAPHLLFAHIPSDNPVAMVDAVIALTHVDLAAPAHGIGTCWAGFVSMAAGAYEPLQRELALPAGRKCAYAMMLGRNNYEPYGIPRRNPLEVTWQ